MDSGWNWTPLILNCLCLIDIIWLFWSTEVISKQLGIDLSIIHEWYLPTRKLFGRPSNKRSFVKIIFYGLGKVVLVTIVMLYING